MLFLKQIERNVLFADRRIVMILKQKEKDAITELQTQEKICVEKYRRYKEQAKDPELKNLFGKLEQEEQKHYDSLEQVLNG
ncbi:MAG: ferritin-like domain-containing protein, partial [Lachnospiraceae bacterium]|nr:ferritin-like domain-containing protein [Lachnospiraceae bacterium]